MGVTPEEKDVISMYNAMAIDLMRAEHERRMQELTRRRARRGARKAARNTARNEAPRAR